MLESYVEEEKNLNIQEKFGDPSDIENLKSKKNTQRTLSHRILSKYKSAIDSLEKRQEIFYLIQALNEIGNIFSSFSNLKQSEENWSESLDKIFQVQESYKIFRKIFSENPPILDNNTS